MCFLRIKVLLGQCNSQLERAQQTLNFNRQWEKYLIEIQSSFEIYQKQLNQIREEQNSLIHLDTIENIQQIRLQCEQNLKQLETFSTTVILHSTKKESNRTQIR